MPPINFDQKTFLVACTAENLFFHGATFLGKSVVLGARVLSVSKRVDLVAWSVLTKSLGRAVWCSPVGAFQWGGKLTDSCVFLLRTCPEHVKLESAIFNQHSDIYTYFSI
jgi:hypothetical protein